MGTTCEGVVTEILKDRRKELLTKKVTKWVIVLPAPERGEEYISQGRLWDSKSAADRFAELNYAKIVGTYPIEIELPL